VSDISASGRYHIAAARSSHYAGGDVIAARLATLLYLVVAAFGGGDLQISMAASRCAHLAPASEPAASNGLHQSDDGDDDDDDDVGDLNFDDDLLPAAMPTLAGPAPQCSRLILADVRAPASAPRDPLFRPPRAPSA